MFDTSLFGDLEPRGSKEEDKKLISRLGQKAKAPSSSRGNTLKDKVEWIRHEVDRHLSFLFDKVEACREEERLKVFFDNFINQDKGAIDTETLGLDYFKDKIYGWSTWAEGEKSLYVPVLHKGYVTGNDLDRQLSPEFIGKQLERVKSSNTKLVFHNAKFDMHMIYHNFGVMLPCWWDTMIASRLLHSSEEDHSLKYQYNVKVKKESGKPYDFKTLFSGMDPNLVPIDIMTPYAAGDTFETLGLQKYQEEEFKKYPGIYNVFKNIEMPLLPVIVDMEERGVCVDLDVLKQMKEKYLVRYEEAKKECLDELEKYSDKINTYNLRNPGKLSNPINLGSPAQVAILFYDIIGLPESQKYKRGTGKKVLELYKGKNEFIDKLVNLRDAEKLVNGFINSIPEFIKEDGKVHPDFVQIKGTGNTNEEDEENGADTGRFSCIAEGQYVQVVNGQKRIEDIEIGDYVYCYGDDGSVHLSKVTNKFDNGIRDCVEILWQSTGTHTSGNLVCTPDHKIRLKTGNWVQAKDLKRFDKLSHLRRGIGENGRPRLYGSNNFCELEHNVIKRDYFKCENNSMCIHHKDEDKTNNSLNNLEIMTLSKHSKYHANELLEHDRIDTRTFCSNKYREKARQNARITVLERLPKEEVIRLLLENNASPTKCGYDYSTIMLRIKEYGINLDEIKEICEGTDVDNFTRVFFEENGKTTKIAKRLHIGLGKVRKYVKKYDLCYNHMVQSVKFVGKRHVYDLEVLDYHNFVVSEICVHNCKAPNLQQIPGRGEKSELRKMFCASPGYVMMSSDYSQQEVRVLAHCSGDEDMLSAYRNNKDLYALMASKVYKKSYEDCLEFYPEGTKLIIDGKEIICKNKEHTNKEGKKRRSSCKSLVLGIMYGRGQASIAEQIGSTLDEAKDLIDTFYKEFPNVRNWMNKVEKSCSENGYVDTLAGRRRELPDALLDEYEFKNKGGRPKDFNPLSFMSPETANELDYTVDEDTKNYYIDKLKKAYGWKAKEEVINEARSEGIEIKDNSQYKAKAMRQAVNTTIQGTSADMSKLAMLYCAQNEELTRLGFKILFPVHDEIIAEAPKETAKRCGELMSEMMVKAANELCPSVPFKCDVEYMERWGGDSLECDENGNWFVADSH